MPLIFADTRSISQWPKGERCNQPASLLDIFPTLVELSALDPVESLEGTSLMSLLENPGQKTERAVVTTHGFQNHAVQSERWRYIRYSDGSEELYDHANDPNEFTNLSKHEQFSAKKAELANCCLN